MSSSVGTSPPALKSVIARLDSSPVRRRRVLAPTPLVYAMAAQRQTSVDDESADQRSITTSMATSTASTANYRPIAGQRSPAKPSRSPYHSSSGSGGQQHKSTPNSPERVANSQDIKRQASIEYKKLMSTNNNNNNGTGGRHKSPTAVHQLVSNGSSRRHSTGSGGGGGSAAGGQPAVPSVIVTNSTRYHQKSNDGKSSQTDSGRQMNGDLSPIQSAIVRTSDMSSMTSDGVSSYASITTGQPTTTTRPKQLPDDTPDKQCNRFGFFVDSNKTDVVPELKKQDIDLQRKREKKWIQMLAKWDKFINNKWKVVRDRCRKGIPHSMRGQAWLYLCGAHHQIKLHPDAYRDLCAQDGNEQIVDEITKDIHRQFPNHELFARPMGTGQQDLLNVLKAFSILKPDIGYCQGQAPIASVLLMHMPAEQAFWSLVAICDHYLPGYFSPGLEAIQIHGDMLFAFLKRFTPNAHKLMDKQKIEPILFMTEWFMCVFARTLPWTSVLRVWDMFLCEGIKVVFKCAIVLVSVTLKSDTKKTCPSMYETLEKLRNLSVYHMSDVILIDSILRCELTDADLQREHNIQEKKRRQKAIQQSVAKQNGGRRK